MGHCTAREAAAFFAKIGGMTPSVCCSARGLRADRHDKLLKLFDTGGQNCTPNNRVGFWKSFSTERCEVAPALEQLAAVEEVIGKPQGLLADTGEAVIKPLLYFLRTEETSLT